MKKKKTSIKDLYQIIMFCHIIVLISCIGGSVSLIANYKIYIENQNIIISTISSIFIFISLTIVIIFSMKFIVNLLKDKKALKNHEYITIIGKVLKFNKNIDSESNTQINNNPTVLILDKNEKIELIVGIDEIMVGETYKFNYLKNSKIAEVVEKIIEQ